MTYLAGLLHAIAAFKLSADPPAVKKAITPIVNITK